MKPFYGNHDGSIDDKNRLLIPSDLRRVIEPEIDGECFLAVTGINFKLWLYPERAYENHALGMRSELAPPTEQLEFDAANFGMATRIDPDKQGRVLLPEKLIRKAGLKKEVTIVGNRDHIEVWDREDWAAYEADIDRRRAEIAMKARERQQQTQTAGSLQRPRD